VTHPEVGRTIHPGGSHPRQYSTRFRGGGSSPSRTAGHRDRRTFHRTDARPTAVGPPESSARPGTPARLRASVLHLVLIHPRGVQPDSAEPPLQDGSRKGLLLLGRDRRRTTVASPRSPLAARCPGTVPWRPSRWRPSRWLRDPAAPSLLSRRLLPLTRGAAPPPVAKRPPPRVTGQPARLCRCRPGATEPSRADSTPPPLKRWGTRDSEPRAAPLDARRGAAAGRAATDCRVSRVSPRGCAGVDAGAYGLGGPGFCLGGVDSHAGAIPFERGKSIRLPHR
jgi:hypothetical protein